MLLWGRLIKCATLEKSSTVESSHIYNVKFFWDLFFIGCFILTCTHLIAKEPFSVCELEYLEVALLLVASHHKHNHAAHLFAKMFFSSFYDSGRYIQLVKLYIWSPQTILETSTMISFINPLSITCLSFSKLSWSLESNLFTPIITRWVPLARRSFSSTSTLRGESRTGCWRSGGCSLLFWTCPAWLVVGCQTPDLWNGPPTHISWWTTHPSSPTSSTTIPSWSAHTFPLSGLVVCRHGDVKCCSIKISKTSKNRFKRSF